MDPGPSFFIPFHVRNRWQPESTIPLLGFICYDLRNVFSYIEKNNAMIHKNHAKFGTRKFVLKHFHVEIRWKRNDTFLFLGFRFLDSRLEFSYIKDKWQSVKISRKSTKTIPFTSILVASEWHLFNASFQMS